MLHTRYILLLRGINVGGKNIIKMADLKACMAGMGFSNVTTYIQSGNVLLNSKETDHSRLMKQIEKTLSEQFGYKARTVLITQEQLKKIVENAPDGFGKDQANYKYDVMFLKEPLTAVEAIKSIPAREGVDQQYPGEGVVYFSRLVNRLPQSYLSKLTTQPIYQEMTIRNWNTTTKLLDL